MRSWLGRRWTHTLIGGSLFFLVVVGIASYPLFSFLHSVRTGDIRVCPDVWYQDRFPVMLAPWDHTLPNRDTFVIDGSEYQRKDVDVDWVEANCPQTKRVRFD